MIASLGELEAAVDTLAKALVYVFTAFPVIQNKLLLLP